MLVIRMSCVWVWGLGLSCTVGVIPIAMDSYVWRYLDKNQTISVQLTFLVSLEIQTPDNTDVPEPIANNCLTSPSVPAVQAMIINLMSTSIGLRSMCTTTLFQCKSVVCESRLYKFENSFCWRPRNVLCVSKGCMNLKSNLETDLFSTRWNSPKLHFSHDIVVGILQRGGGRGWRTVPVPAPVPGVSPHQLCPRTQEVGEVLPSGGVRRCVSKHGRLKVSQVLVVVPVQDWSLKWLKTNVKILNSFNNFHLLNH